MTRIRSHSSTPPMPAPKAASRSRVDAYLEKRRTGERLSIAETIDFLKGYRELSPSDRRHFLKDLLVAAAEADGCEPQELPGWKNASAEQCLELLGGQDLPSPQQVEEQLHPMMMKMWRNGEAIRALQARERSLTPEQKGELAQRLENRETMKAQYHELQDLRTAYAFMPKHSAFQDTGVVAEVTLKGNAGPAGGSAGVGLYVGHQNDKRHAEPYVAASGTALGLKGRGMVGTEHRAFEKGVSLGVSVSSGNPYLPNKVSTGIGVAGISAADGGALGANVQMPIPGVGLYPLVSMGFELDVIDPRLEPATEKVAAAREAVGAKIHRGVDATKKALHIGKKPAPADDGFED